ncbi:hypothetical protein [Corallococcus sp. CA047B]|uniref:hypothetical protein n=1 Tax=Corallococcus sp. CA047B TaxID=2316729 RepID=UPI001F2FB25D|nr:hypothetical protein [Corallococcus sp. CA047B]
MADKVAKGRHQASRGEEQGLAVLTEADVVAIREAYAAGKAGLRKLARQYRVSTRTIAGACYGRTWRHVPSPYMFRPRAKTKLTEMQVRAIRTRHAAGERCNALAREYGVSDDTISSIVRRFSWKNVE